MFLIVLLKFVLLKKILKAHIQDLLRNKGLESLIHPVLQAG